MVENGNLEFKFNDFSNQEEIPYKILSYLLESKSNVVENFWKCLKHPSIDCLDRDNLTLDEKKSMIWKGEPKQDDYQIFLKPLIGDSLPTAQSQTQLRIFRYGTVPINQYTSTILIELDVITNESSSMIYNENGFICERTDKLEGYLLSLLNGRDIGVGSDVFRFDRTLSRTCQSLMNISNSKSFYGRTIILGLQYTCPTTGGTC